MTSEERKTYPVFTAFMKYFPDAIMEVSHHSWKANEKHNPGEEVYWNRELSTDETDALARHMIDLAKGEKFCEDGLRTSTSIAWRAMASLQKELEAEQEQHKFGSLDYKKEKASILFKDRIDKLAELIN